MKEFLIEYWRDILSIVVMLTTLVLWLVRKKPVKVIDTIKESILRLLPYCISEAEKLTGVTGADKKAFALDMISAYLKEFISCGDDELKTYLQFASEQVEVILSTPQKKG